MNTSTDNTDGLAHNLDNDSSWHCFGREMPKMEVVFFFQIFIIFIVVMTCVINLSINNGNSNLWTALLSSCLGYILPSPSPTSNSRSTKDDK
jgi:hypothetical protein